MRSWSSAVSPFGSQVMMVQVSTTSPLARSCQRSHSPAKPKGAPCLRRMRYGCLGPLPWRRHS